LGIRSLKKPKKAKKTEKRPKKLQKLLKREVPQNPPPHQRYEYEQSPSTGLFHKVAPVRRFIIVEIIAKKGYTFVWYGFLEC
jgi:hypothetical protein